MSIMAAFFAQQLVRLLQAKSGNRLLQSIYLIISPFLAIISRDTGCVNFKFQLKE
jgi:hypothetical protein